MQCGSATALNQLQSYKSLLKPDKSPDSLASLFRRGHQPTGALHPLLATLQCLQGTPGIGPRIIQFVWWRRWRLGIP